MKKYFYAFLLLPLLASTSLFANNGGDNDDLDRQQKYQLHINKTSEKIKLDGKLDEAIWQNAEIASDFWYSFPIDDKKAELSTKIKVAYDDNFVYVAAVMHDPNGTIIQTLKRDVDFWSGDNIVIVLDPGNQKSNGFMFGVNPYGVQMEGLLTGDTGSRGSRPGSGAMNSRWDNKWYSKTIAGTDNWVAEIAIPFKSLRYDETKTTWGINFIRTEASDNSFHTWSHVPVQFRSVDLNYTGALLWDKAPKKAKGNVAVIPYISGSNFKDFEVAGNPVENKLNVGVDAKIAITSSLNLDVTVNPDFSQVEVDEQVTNLTRFNIRLPERRLFFLENTDIFEDFGNSPARPFFSRKIGLDDDGNSIPILYGLRLTGNATKTLRVGLLNMQTKQTDEFAGQNYTATAFRQQIFGRSVIKGFFTNRQAYQDSEFSSTDYGRNAGLEFNYLSTNNKWQSWAGYNHSFKEDITDKNYYFKGGVRYRDRNWAGLVNYYEVQDQYFADMGFLGRLNHYDAVQDTTYRIGFGSLFSDLNYTIYPKKKGSIISQQFSVFNWWVTKANGGDFLERTNSLSYRLSFRGRSSFYVRYANSAIDLQYPFTFTGDEPLPAQKYTTNSIQVQYRSDSRKVFTYEAEVRYSGFYSGTRTSLELEGNVRAQPWGNFGLKFAYNDLQFGGIYGERQLFSVSPKIEVSFSNNLFWTTFIQYNTQAENFNINSRLQWRFAPMSDVFLVYTDNYLVETDDTASDFRIQNFGPKNRALVFKVNYWFSL